ncbi:ran-specific GTPase-activating protein-like [Oscarella lobularis]|uniref:ran-specific GTPase-activating protein-like n=1 Tax=Oscarella lobularis TaxID=121494 RepID=UPI0033144805
MAEATLVERSHQPEEETQNPEPHFEPLVHLADVEVKTLEEDENEIFKIRAKLYRYTTESEAGEWKERGVGEVKILKHKQTNKFRLVMRRDKTLKVCANHLITTDMELKPNVGSDRAWVWNVPADFAEETPRPELLAIRFGNAENAQKFKAAFVDCQKQLKSPSSSAAAAADDVTKELEKMTVKEKEEKESTSKDDEKKETSSESDSNTPDKPSDSKTPDEPSDSKTPDEPSKSKASDEEKKTDAKDE